ncbi:MAG: hypothetical protein Q9M10_02780 [Mariprofundaceae bacterium]|nr:hypothetical protein [Mariprofundaceae bacterium]
MAIQNTIKAYLDAVEEKFGHQAREKTVLTHRNGVSFYLKRPDQHQPSLVDMGMIQLMTKQMKRTEMKRTAA